MTNEEAADALKRLIYPTHAPYHNEVIRLAIAALRTPPATGAAMREAAARIADGFSTVDDYATGRFDAADEIAAAIRALPAPEVPEAVRNSRYDEMVALLEDAKGVLCNPANYRSGFDPVLKMARAYFKAYGGGL